VFTFRWQEDPRKGGTWYEDQKRKLNYDPVIIAQELDIDYTASIEGVIIPGEHVRAAVNFPLPESGYTKAGWDVAGEGDNLNAIAPRIGNVIKPLITWSKLGTSQSTHKCMEICRDLGVRALNYDSAGLGQGPTDVLRTATTIPDGLNIRGINTGDTPTDTLWVDGKTSKNKFVNLKAELWWRLKERFRKTHERVNNIRHWPDSDCISIPNNGDLIAQLSMPLGEVREDGKFKVESKKDLKARVGGSPDLADAVILTEASVAGSWTELMDYQHDRLQEKMSDAMRQQDHNSPTMHPAALGEPASESTDGWSVFKRSQFNRDYDNW